ncbi:hypothetical protein BGZ47_006763 [Haplosporangium gracile]|nr:hypothetical protein BGZ47_006763 [Haplosporangium gracile]
MVILKSGPKEYAANVDGTLEKLTQITRASEGLSTLHIVIRDIDDVYSDMLDEELLGRECLKDLVTQHMELHARYEWEVDVLQMCKHLAGILKALPKFDDLN